MHKAVIVPQIISHTDDYCWYLSTHTLFSAAMRRTAGVASALAPETPGEALEEGVESASSDSSSAATLDPATSSTWSAATESVKSH